MDLHHKIDSLFDLEDIRSLCFELGIDYDSVRGEGKAARVRELLLALARQKRLPELMMLLAEIRPLVDWPTIPDDIEVPVSLAEQTPPVTSVKNVTYGDVVYGDKTGGDKVAGDKITSHHGSMVGNSLFVDGNHRKQKTFDDGVMPVFVPLLNHVSQQVPVQQRGVVVQKVLALQAEVKRGETADDETVASLVEDIVDSDSTSGFQIVMLFDDPVVSKNVGDITTFVLRRIQRKL